MTQLTRRDLFRNSLTCGGAALVGGLGAPNNAFGNDKESPVAETQYGKVRGASVQGVHIFRGIPYGGPTEGAGRFLPPSKPQAWKEIRDTTQTGPRCVQGPSNIFLSPMIGEYFGGGRKDRIELAKQEDSENCLNLNVLTPGLRGKRPVLIYIHGGGFTGGSAQLTLFADAFPREQDVVLVGINHRLNVFGYLYLGDLSEKYAAGNVGQLDLILALEWVRDNIANFGGDPANVTIFGESGGGAKISALMAMPAAKGLYHKAIVESGSVLRVSTREEAAATAKTVLEKLGLTEKELDELQKIPASEFLEKASQGAGGPGQAQLRLGPVIDGRSILRQTWDPKAPETSAGIPMIIGNCKDESTLFALRDEALFKLDDAGLRERVVKDGIPENEVDKLLAAYRKDHPKDTPSDTFFRMSTDRGARRNAVKQAELKIEQGKAGVYLYYFAWDTPIADGKIKAFHTAELPLAMRLVRYPESEQLSKQIAGAWAAFARKGNPNHRGLPQWPAYSTTQRATMIFDASKSEVVNDPDREERLLLQDRPSGRSL
jgi:para-nitrobenzyl esterase